MKKWTHKQIQAHMKKRQRQNLAKSLRNAHENEVWERLKRHRLHWERQVIRGGRIFDFFCKKVRVAIEVDGASHDGRRDERSDLKVFGATGVVVLRMGNGDMDRLEEILASIDSMNPLKADDRASRNGWKRRL